MLGCIELDGFRAEAAYHPKRIIASLTPARKQVRDGANPKTLRR